MKKRIAILLSMIITISSMTGCGSSTNDDSNSKESGTETKDDSDSKESDDIEYTDEGYDKRYCIRDNALSSYIYVHPDEKSFVVREDALTDDGKPELDGKYNEYNLYVSYDRKSIDYQEGIEAELGYGSYPEYFTKEICDENEYITDGTININGYDILYYVSKSSSSYKISSQYIFQDTVYKSLGHYADFMYAEADVQHAENLTDDQIEEVLKTIWTGDLILVDNSGESCELKDFDN